MDFSIAILGGDEQSTTGERNCEKWRMPCVDALRVPPAGLLLEKLDNCFGARVNTELLEHLFDVPVHCPHADAQRIGNLLIRKTLAQANEYLVLAVGEIRKFLLLLLLFGEIE